MNLAKTPILTARGLPVSKRNKFVLTQSKSSRFSILKIYDEPSYETDTPLILAKLVFMGWK